MKELNQLMKEKGLRLRSRVWIEDQHGKTVIGEGRAKILELIDRTGSINQTAKKMGMSYRGVWGKLRATEEALGFRFIQSEGRSGSTLTPEGKRFLELYQELKKKCIEIEDRLFGEIFSPPRPRRGIST